jgi:hypothetical protein
MERVSLHFDLLRQANASLTRFLERPSGAPAVGTAEEVEALLHLEKTLRSVGVLLGRGVQNISDADLRKELGRYRENLLSLRRELSLMQDRAIACRAKLDSHQQHLHAARAWCIASRQTSQ